MGIIKEIFVWWDGNTWGTRFFTMRKGRLVGEDEVVLGLVGDHLAAETFRDHVDRLVPALGQHVLELVPGRLLGGLAEVHQLPHDALGAVGPAIAALGHRDSVDAVAPAGEGQGKALCDASGIAARGVKIEYSASG